MYPFANDTNTITNAFRSLYANYDYHIMFLYAGNYSYGISCSCNPWTQAVCVMVFGPKIDDGNTTGPANYTMATDPGSCFSTCEYGTDPLFDMGVTDRYSPTINDYAKTTRFIVGDAFYAFNLYRTDLENFYNGIGYNFFNGITYLMDQWPGITYSEALHNHLLRIANNYYCTNGTLTDPNLIVNSEFSKLQITYYKTLELNNCKLLL